MPRDGERPVDSTRLARKPPPSLHKTGGTLEQDHSLDYAGYLLFAGFLALSLPGFLRILCILVGNCFGPPCSNLDSLLINEACLTLLRASAS